MDKHDIKFWVAVAGAIVIKLLFSESFSLARASATVAAAVFAAWAFTDSVLLWAGLPDTPYGIPVAALLALTGENAMRWLIQITPEKALNAWRGKK